MTAAAADYDMTGVAPPPPPLDPPPPPPPPPPSPSPALREAAASTAPPLDNARPVVDQITVTTRRAVYDEAGNTAHTVEVAMRATPDPNQPASASLDRLWAAANAKARQYLKEATP